MPGLLLPKDPRCSYRPCHAGGRGEGRAEGRWTRRAQHGSPVFLVWKVVFLWKNLEKGAFFFHTICWCGWLEPHLYLMSCMYVSISTAGLSVDSVWLCCECAYRRGTVPEGRKTIYVYYSSFMHLILQAKTDTWRLSNPNYKLVGRKAQYLHRLPVNH